MVKQNNSENPLESSEEYEKRMSEWYKEKKYTEALNASVKRLEIININSFEDDNLVNNVKKHLITLNNIYIFICKYQ